MNEIEINERKKSNNSTIDFIVKDKERNGNPTLFIAMPEVGLVSVIIAWELIKQEKMNEVGMIGAQKLLPVTILEDGYPKSPIRLWSGNGFDILKSDIPIKMGQDFTLNLTKSIIDFAESNYEKIVFCSGLPTQNRNSMGLDELELYALSTTTTTHQEIDELPHTNHFEQGVVTGIYASLINLARNANIPLQGFYVSSYPNFPDPIASARILKEVLNPLLDLNIDTEKLMTEGDKLQLQFRKLASQIKQVQRLQDSSSHQAGLYV
jgi:predicted ATP-grasp superfamily ATP-dependent carboligase